MEQRAAYHRGESPEPGASRGHDFSATSDDLSNTPGLQSPFEKKESANASDVQGCGSPDPELRHSHLQQQQQRSQGPPQDTGPVTPSLAVLQEGRTTTKTGGDILGCLV